MTTDLWMLVYSSLLCLFIPGISLYARLKVPGGIAWGLSNRDAPFEVPAWAARAQRAHANLVENLAPFAALVLVAHVSGKANDITALGAILFFIGRVAHMVVYTAGVTRIRTVVFFVAYAGNLAIFLQLLG